MAIPYNFKIHTLSEIKHRLFPNHQSDNKLENADLIDGFDLFTYFPARYQDTNKKALLDDIIQKKKYSPSHRDILLTRFYPKELPNIYTSEQHNDANKTYSFIANVFDYESPTETNVIDWHMNFANCDIFSFYHGSLLAQDELQVVECPQLASVREYLLQQAQSTKDRKLFDTRVIGDNSSPYPILISNVERVINLDTKNLYGNRFSSSPTSIVLESYDYLQPPQTVNLIAIEAPKYGYGPYKTDQINYILQACFTAYSAAKGLENGVYKLTQNRDANKPLKTTIHTGWFGCGAYGGNRVLMIVLQILAAKMAGIDQLIFHTVTDCRPQTQSAETFLKNIFDRGQKQLTKDELIEKIIKEKFQWGFTNGT